MQIVAEYSPGDADMLQRLASRFDPRIVYPDLLAKRAFDRFAAIFGLLEVDLQSIRRLAGWRSEDWPSAQDKNDRVQAREHPEDVDRVPRRDTRTGAAVRCAPGRHMIRFVQQPIRLQEES